MLIELSIILTYLVSGAVVARLLEIKGLVTPFLGYILGIGVFIAIGLVQVVTPIPTWPLLTMALTLIFPFALWRTFFPKQKLDFSIRVIVITLVFSTLLVLVFRSINLVSWSGDSYGYLASSILIADNQFELNSINTIVKRSLGAPLAHSPAQLSGEFYLQSFAPILSISTLAVLAWFICKGFNFKTLADRRLVYAGAILGILLLITNHRYLFNSFYINGHLLFSSFLLVIAASGWLLATKTSRLSTKSLIWLQSLVIPALVVTRPEAALVILLALLPTLLLSKIPWKLRALPLIATGAATIMWQGFIAAQYVERGSDVPFEVLGMLILGLATIISSKFLNIGWLKNRFYSILSAVELGIWGILILFTILDSVIAIKSLRSVYYNLALGEGLWGLSLIILGYFALVMVILLVRDKKLTFLRFPVTTFIPLMFVVAYLRDGAYRVGPGDSFNRMLMHFLPLLILFVVVGTISLLLKYRLNKHT